MAIQDLTHKACGGYKLSKPKDMPLMKIVSNGQARQEDEDGNESADGAADLCRGC